ncbi:type II secretion system F family protein [Tumebacillus sp. DT12]|uniref:Type II secretion system F family protein n=1 Tax=Tumebacillus lacus TaxID=2995335 RepID=A0ABT3X3F5_9BACL|nr:type II secretion system F family protein [Tumebacillus lacus]MCX7571426.1 type II secretion system F family protein [Tumebacillus lacus]
MVEVRWGRWAGRLARLLDAGVPMLQALDFLAADGPRREADRTRSICQALREGRRFSSVLQTQGAPLMMQTLVEVGESNGDLAGSLFRASDYCEERARWRKERMQAMSYPLLVVALLLVLCLFLFAVVIPRFAALYSGMGLTVGTGTQMLFGAAKAGPFLILLSIPFVVLVAVFARKKPKLAWLQVGHRLPYLRSWLRVDRTHEWAATLGLLLDGGLPLAQALHVQSQLPLQPRNRETCVRVRSRVLTGQPLGEALAEEELDRTLALTVRVAEMTGDLARSLLAAERELAERRRRMMNGLLKLFEPLLLLGAGLLTGLVALLMLWPMMDLLQTI